MDTRTKYTHTILTDAFPVYSHAAHSVAWTYITNLHSHTKNIHTDT